MRINDIYIEVTHSDIISAINDLANNKSCGLDGVNAEHLKHCSDRILPMLAMCFTGLFIHGVLPPSMISVVLVPIVKNKRISIWASVKLGDTLGMPIWLETINGI